MSPHKARHQQIVSNLVRPLYDLAAKKGCGAYPGLAILSVAMDDFAPIPDIVVHCGPMPPDGYVAEVLSPSTISNDRGRKSDFYRRVPSLRCFLRVYQNEVWIEVRRQDGGWAMEVFGPGDAVEFPELDGAAPLADVFVRITF